MQLTLVDHVNNNMGNAVRPDYIHSIQKNYLPRENAILDTAYSRFWNWATTLVSDLD